MNKAIKKLPFNSLDKKASQIRRDVIDVCVKNGAGHLAPSLSCLEILTALYYRTMNIYRSPVNENRDRLVFSKAHGAYALYAILAYMGYVNRKDWLNFYKGSYLPGCIERNIKHGMEAGCGSLGHGLPIATGIAFGAKLQNKKFRVYCNVGDGEMQEGSNWEAAQVAVKHRLSNLTVIVDNNKLQAMDFLDNILTLKGRTDDIKRKFMAFGFKAALCDGHSAVHVAKALKRIAAGGNSPQVLIADTVKGYGLTCMENVPKFHFRLPTEKELGMGRHHG